MKCIENKKNKIKNSNKHNANFRNGCRKLDFAITRIGYQSLNKIAPIKTGTTSPK